MKPIFNPWKIIRISGLVACLLFAPAHASESSQPVPLDALIDEIIEGNPELAYYQSAIEAAAADRRVAGTRGDPTLSFDIGRKRVTEPTGELAGEGTAWAVTVSQNFEWPGRIALRKAIANHDLELARLGLAQFEATLAARARTLAFSLYAAHQRAAATAEVAARYRALREVFLAREPGGITPLLETRVIEAEELVLQHRATEAQLGVQSAVVEINLLRGRPVETPITIQGAKPVFNNPPQLEESLAAAKEYNFDFRAARIELEQQGMIVSLARKDRFPSVTVSPYYSEEKAGDRERTYGIGVSLPLPVSAGTRAGVSAAEARRRQAEAAMLVAQREMEKAVAAASHTFAAKVAEMRKWSPDSAKKFREAAELADRHYRLGAVPISTYVELQNSYLEAIDALFETELEALEAGATLELLTGRDFTAVETQP